MAYYYVYRYIRAGNLYNTLLGLWRREKYRPSWTVCSLPKERRHLYSALFFYSVPLQCALPFQGVIKQLVKIVQFRKVANNVNFFLSWRIGLVGHLTVAPVLIPDLAWLCEFCSLLFCSPCLAKLGCMGIRIQIMHRLCTNQSVWIRATKQEGSTFSEII